MPQAERVHYRSMMWDSARWDDVVLRPGDIVISTPPKCGTTWMQRICSLLVFQVTELDRPLDEISPWVDMLTRDAADVAADLEGQTHRRFIKTHTPLDGLPWDDRVTYITVARDPRDVALSWDNHLDNTDMVALFTARSNAVGLDDIMEKLAEGPPERQESEVDRFWEWIDNDEPRTEANSLSATLSHLATFWNARERLNVVLTHYDDLSADLDGQMRALSARLGIDIGEDRWPDLVQAATFGEMKRRATEIAPEAPKAIWRDPSRFFNAGTSGQWRRLLDDDGLARYRRRVARLTSPDLAGWIHHDGSFAAT